MGVEVNGMADVFEELDELEDDYGGATEDYVVGTNAEYAPPLEYGSDPHIIRAEDGYLRFENSDGEIIYRKQVQHPGTDPTPFFRPAIAEVKSQGPLDFIESNTEKDAEDIGSTREFVATLALALERRIKEIITEKGLIDTGNLRASVGSVPITDISDLPDGDELQ